MRDTREKQIQLWKELILDYCKTQKVFLIGVEEDFPLFSNSAIDSMIHSAFSPDYKLVFFALGS